MKVLSIQNPWAVLVAAGIKDVENRGQRTNYRGRLLIHALKFDCPWLNSVDMPKKLRAEIAAVVESGTDDLHGPVAAFDSVLRSCIDHYRLPQDMDECTDPSAALAAALKKYGAPYPKGAIIGEAELADCVYEHESEWAAPYKWKWVMKNAILYPVSEQIINVKGHLGIWNYEK